jgi:hypothetical protein
MVLFGLERDQLRLVCGVCAAMRTGLPDPGCSSRGDGLTPAQTAIKIYLEQIPLPRYGEGEESWQLWCPFSAQTGVVFCCISLIPAADVSQLLESGILPPRFLFLSVLSDCCPSGCPAAPANANPSLT